MRLGVLCAPSYLTLACGKNENDERFTLVNVCGGACGTFIVFPKRQQPRWNNAKNLLDSSLCLCGVCRKEVEWLRTMRTNQNAVAARMHEKPLAECASLAIALF